MKFDKSYQPPGCTDISPAEAVAALQMALDRGECREGTAWFGKVAQIKYGEDWLEIAETDLKDHVAIGVPLGRKTPAEVVAKMKRRCGWGARLTKDVFYCITAFSDG